MAEIDLRNLPRDCDCMTHDEPHWLYMDKLQAQMNLDILRRGGQLCLRAYALEEAARLREKQFNLRRAGVKDDDTFLLPEGYRERDYEALWRELLQEKMQS